MDYTFYTEDGNYLHFEFQTTNRQEDIRRFMFYDTSLHYKGNRKIRTVVVYSSDIQKCRKLYRCRKYQISYRSVLHEYNRR